MESGVNVKKMSDDELREGYDGLSTSVDAASMYSEEINHRELMAFLKHINTSLEAINYNIGVLQKKVKEMEGIGG